MKKVLTLFIVLLWTSSSYAGLDDAWSILKRRKGRTTSYPQVVKHLVAEGMYFASVPYIKEYLATTSSVKKKEIDVLIDEVVTAVGIRQFEVLPTRILERSNAPMLRYILAKKYFRIGKYNKALQTLNASIPRSHPAKAFALNLEGSIFSIQGKYKNSISAFKQCSSRSERDIKKYDEENRKKQLSINRDNCIVGIARAQFAAHNWEEASLSYLDLSKNSHVWPEILFEEAWNSFYLKDYNRTLGKLVTYKAPIMDFVFNPEIDTLQAMTYMHLCLWSDANKVVNNFYKKYAKQTLAVKRFLRKNGKNYKYYYLMAKSKRSGKVSGTELLNKLLKSIIKDPAFQELYDSFQNGRDELEALRKVSSGPFKKILSLNLKEAMLLQRDLIGAYVRKSLYIFMDQLDQAFKGMSYIRLEVLKKKKDVLYEIRSTNKRKRGDIRNLQRNEKQYFWTFNGEFWADELGDYVFSLKSECR